MRVFTASLATETNTFSPIPTDLDSFLSAFYATRRTSRDPNHLLGGLSSASASAG